MQPGIVAMCIEQDDDITHTRCKQIFGVWSAPSKPLAKALVASTRMEKKHQWLFYIATPQTLIKKSIKYSVNIAWKTRWWLYTYCKYCITLNLRSINVI
jgi:hypothetical protein